MKTTILTISVIILNLLLFGCNKSIDRSAVKTDAIQVVEALSGEPQAESTTTLTSNEEVIMLDEEIEKEEAQPDGEIIEFKDKKEELSEKENIEEEESDSPVLKESELSEIEIEIEEEESAEDTQEESTAKTTDSPPTKTEEKEEESTSPASPIAAHFAASDQFLKQYVSGGSVAYSKIKKASLNQLAEQIANADLSQSSSAEKQAFYINAYNILVIKALKENGIPSSPLDVLGFFDAKKHKVAGQNLTLDELEKGKLFGLKRDARFHFAVVCGAKGCPQIEPFAYTASNLNAKLNQQTRKAINDPNFTRVNHDTQKVELSEIFKWYEADFKQGGTPLIEFLNQYRTEEIPYNYTVEYYPYDWKINKR